MTKVQAEIAEMRTGGGVQARKTSKKKTITVAEALKSYADENSGAVGKKRFTELLKMFTKTNIVAQLKDYNKKFPEKSIVALILGETMSDKEDQREALVGEGGGKDKIMGIFTLLLERAKDLGVDAQTLATYKQDFTTELNKQLDKFMSSVRYDSTKLDNLMNALIQTIDNYQAGKAKPDSTVKLKGSGAAVSKTQMEAYNTASKRFNKAQRDFNAQMKQDGWAGDVADAFGRIYGSKNVADKVRADLKTCKQQMNQLKAALEQGDVAFRAKFEEIYGIPYNARNIQAYRDIEKTYLAAAKAKAQEDAFKNEFSLLLNNKPLAEEGKMVTQSVSAGTSTYVTTATKADVYKREFNKLAKLMGKNGANQLNALVNGLAGTDASLEKKYEALQKLTQSTFKNLQGDTKKACGGRNFDSVQKQYDNSYKAAYGVENDIMKRVTDYNISQQKGAGVVKGIGTALLTVAGTAVAVGSAGTLTPAVAATVAGVAAAAPAVVEVSDRATSGKALDSLRKDGVLAWLKTTNEETDWGSVAKTSLINGALAVVFMGQSYAVTGLCMKAGLGATATGVANGAGIAATGLGAEYLMTGEISVEGAIFTVTMAVVGGVMTVKSIKAANAAESKARAEQHATDIQTSRQALGFEDGVEITPEGLKAQYRKLSLQNHPDKGGSAARMAEINRAYDFLTKNLADLNIAAPKVSTAPAKAAAQATAEPTTTKTSEAQFAEKLAGYKDAKGNPILSSDEITSLLENCQHGYTTDGKPIPNYQAKIEAVLSNPEEVASISGWKSRSAGVFRAIQDPLNSTVEANPAAFGVKSKTTTSATASAEPATAKSSEAQFAEKLAGYKDANGNPILSSDEITSLLENCQHGYTTDGKPIPNYQAKIEAVLSNPEEVASISGWKSRSAGVFRAIQDPLNSTVEANPAAFAKTNATIQETVPSAVVTRPNGTKIDVLAGISKETLASQTAEHLHLPAATTVPDGVGIVIKQGANAPQVEARRIIFADTVEETLRINNEHGIPLKYEANPNPGEKPYFYKDAPYGGRQKVNTQSVEVTYNYDADGSWGVTPEYMAEYADPVTKTAPDRAVVAAGDDPVTGLKGNIAEKQYEIVNSDGSRSPLSVADLEPGQMVHIAKKEGVELRMAIFDHETVSLEGETIPAGKPVMIDSEGHPYAGNPMKRLRSGEVVLPETNDPVGSKIKSTIEQMQKLDAQSKAAKKAGNKELANQLKAQADDLQKQIEPEFNQWLKDVTTSSTIATEVSTSRTGAPLTAQQTENWINIFSKHHKLVENKQGQVAYATMPDGNKKLNYDNNGILISTQDYNDHGQLTGISLFGAEGDNLVVTTLGRAGSLVLDGKAEIYYFNSNGEHISTPSGGDFIRRPLTPEEIAMLRNMEPTDSYIAGVHNNLDAQLPDVSPLNLENFAKPFDNLPKDTKMLITQTNEGVVVTTDDNGHVIEHRFAKIYETNDIRVNFYDKNNNLICTRVYDNAMSKCHNEVIYESGGVTKYIYYNYSDGTPEYRVVERRDNSKTQYNSDGSPKFEYTNENETRYDSDGRLTYKRYVDQNGIEHEIRWSKTLERYIFSE